MPGLTELFLHSKYPKTRSSDRREHPSLTTTPSGVWPRTPSIISGQSIQQVVCRRGSRHRGRRETPLANGKRAMLTRLGGPNILYG